MSTTPLTDAQPKTWENRTLLPSYSTVPADFARDLESQLSRLRAATLERERQNNEAFAELEKERDGLRRVLRWIADGQYNIEHPLTLDQQEDARYTYPARLTAIMHKAEEALSSSPAPSIPAEVQGLVSPDDLAWLLYDFECDDPYTADDPPIIRPDTPNKIALSRGDACCCGMPGTCARCFADDIVQKAEWIAHQLNRKALAAFRAKHGGEES